MHRDWFKPRASDWGSSWVLHPLEKATQWIESIQHPNCGTSKASTKECGWITLVSSCNCGPAGRKQKGFMFKDV
ncbi:hypothetical protein N7478_008621 [Penicillium angulare]|uniref:uncharacterized protein n=1 Tax=Penicillium angulare TaxID=116970 RepID=UPI00254015FE|nr:uncharacterized protein N7478_008621 [Penicillium angulare]KAJ5273496.1 hypothetical protein N7478_008621 [Penicillium angulare]